MNENKLMVGYDQIDITPSYSVETIGFGRTDEHSRGILSNLYAQVSIWCLNDEKCCLVTIDHIGFSRQGSDFLRNEIGKIIGTSKEKVMLCFSHTHSAPNESIEQNYFKSLCDKVKISVKNALNKMTSSSIAWGNASTSIGLNRRKDSNFIDDRIGILKVCDAKTNDLNLIILRLTAHANVLKGDNYLISSDYFGNVRDTLQKKYNCPVMLTQGASGNIAPRYFNSSITPPDACDERFVRSKNALSDMADIVLKDVDSVLLSLKQKTPKVLSMYSKNITLTSEVPSKEKAFEVADEAKRYCGIDGTAWLKEVDRLLKNNITQQYEEIEVQYFILDNGCFCGVSNEIMCEFALKASSILNNNFFYFGGYTNGCSAYFPTEEEFDKGGFEVYWSLLIFYIYHGRVFPLRRNSATELINFVVKNYT